MSEPNNQGGQTNSGNGRNIDTGGGAYLEGGQVTNSGGVNTFGANSGTINYNDYRISAGDEAKLNELFSQLHQSIATAPATTPQEQEAKSDAQEAAKALQAEADTIKKNPDHKPNKFTIDGFIQAFKKLGAPVLGTALTIMGQPLWGAAVNTLAQNIPDTEKK